MIPIPGWLTLKVALAAIVCAACFTAGFQVRGWWAERQEIKAYRMQIDSFRAQADKDRAKLTEQQHALEEVQRDATRWRRKYREEVARDPVVEAWDRSQHPPAIGDILRDKPAAVPDKRPTTARGGRGA